MTITHPVYKQYDMLHLIAILSDQQLHEVSHFKEDVYLPHTQRSDNTEMK